MLSPTARAPVSELAQMLTGRKRDWPDAQMEDKPNLVVKEGEWTKEDKANARKLAGLVKAGTLGGRRRGGQLEVKVGSFFAWLREEVAVRPEWGFDYDPAPDDEAHFVRQL